MRPPTGSDDFDALPHALQRDVVELCGALYQGSYETDARLDVVRLEAFKV